jgi:hypothetical protein
MDYLVYVEHNAENLQFFLWYKDYVRHFEELPENEKVLSPEWIPETTEIPDLSKERKRKAGKLREKLLLPWWEQVMITRALLSSVRTERDFRVRAGICLLIGRMEALLCRQY